MAFSQFCEATSCFFLCPLASRKNHQSQNKSQKYRDLWETNLPREMLYQLALYALGQESGNRRATIVYPTLNAEARQQIIFVKDPFRGTSTAQIILCPVNLLILDQLLCDKGVEAQRGRIEFARRLAFGTSPNPKS